MLKDDRDSGMKLLFAVGLVALSLAMGYSIGLRQSLDAPRNVIGLSPVDASSIAVLEQTGEAARAAGDKRTAEWFAETARGQRGMLLTWASDHAHGRLDPETHRPQVRLSGAR